MFSKLCFCDFFSHFLLLVFIFSFSVQILYSSYHNIINTSRYPLVQHTHYHKSRGGGTIRRFIIIMGFWCRTVRDRDALLPISCVSWSRGRRRRRHRLTLSGKYLFIWSSLLTIDSKTNAACSAPSSPSS